MPFTPHCSCLHSQPFGALQEMSCVELRACEPLEPLLVRCPGLNPSGGTSTLIMILRADLQAQELKGEVGSEQCSPTSTGPSLPITTFLSQQSECLRQNLLTCLCLVLHSPPVFFSTIIVLHIISLQSTLVLCL